MRPQRGGGADPRDNAKCPRQHGAWLIIHGNKAAKILKNKVKETNHKSDQDRQNIDSFCISICQTLKGGFFIAKKYKYGFDGKNSL